jgi:hypothetical protein
MTGHSHVFAYVVEAPASAIAADLDNDKAAQGHSTGALPDEGSIAGAGPQKTARYGSPVRSTAQMMRAFLLATATVARLKPRRSRS